MINFREILDNKLKKIKLVRKINYSFKPQYKIFHKFDLNENSLFIDLGANKGEVTQFVKDKFNCFTESYEPDVYTFKMLKERFQFSKKNKIFNLGISKNSIKKKIYYHKKFNFNNFIYSQSSSFLQKKPNIDVNNFKIVKTLPVKKLLQKHKYIDLIKIDIEGYEYEIIYEIIKNKNKIKNVLCELHGSPKKTNNTGKINNNFLSKKYFKLMKYLESKKLIDNWFFEWV